MAEPTPEGHETGPYTAAVSERVVLHIGTHKTGTTSIQQFLHDQNDTLLARAGAFCPPGFLVPNLHAELPLLTIRPDRVWPARLRFPDTGRPAWVAAARRHVREHAAGSDAAVLVYSHEDLSYLRGADELAALHDLLGERQVDVVVFLREPSAYLRSYREQLRATGFELSTDPTSFAYTEPDSWLVDYDALIASFAGRFGADHVHALDYDVTMKSDGTVIPAFAELLGIERSDLPPLDRYFVNRSGTHLRPTDEQLAAIRRRVAQQAH